MCGCPSPRLQINPLIFELKFNLEGISSENSIPTTLKRHFNDLLSLIFVSEIYLMTLETPYFKFVRDTLSYIVLLLLHFALCLSPSTIPFSGLEWAILVFFIGRYLVEHKQLSDIIQHLKQQRDSGDARAQSKCIPLKALYIYQR